MGQPVRLDFGGGHKREPGWLIVDRRVTRVASIRNATGEALSHVEIVPDIEADFAAPLPLPDDYADEGRAIHVIEHFYPWEILAIVKEWVRVLKPGAELAIECPCLEKMIALANVPDCPPNLLYWGLYGDPRLKEPAMMHKWAYSTKRLAMLFAHAGMVNMRPEPPRFHEPIRDMRMVGVKPVPEPSPILRAMQ